MNLDAYLAQLPILVERDEDDETDTGLAAFSPDRRYRYLLTRRVLRHGGRTAIFCMLNPSNANAWDNDRTVTRCMGFAAREDCSTLMIVNLNARVSTDPTALLEAPNDVGPLNADIQRAVLGHLAVGHRIRDAAIGPVASPVVISAWGGSDWVRTPSALVAKRTWHRLVREAGIDAEHALGFTKHGDPRHPLRLARTTPLDVLSRYAP